MANKMYSIYLTKQQLEYMAETGIHVLSDYNEKKLIDVKEDKLFGSDKHLMKSLSKELKSLETVLPELTDKIGSFSYRTPTNIVGSADITLNLNSNVDSIQDIINTFLAIEKVQKLKILNNSYDPLVSLDYLKSEFSVHIDHRWSEIISNRLLKLVLWYDNEWGYASKVIEQAKYISNIKK